MQPLGLPVRTVAAADIGTFVPFETEPPQVPQNRRLRLTCRPLDVGILDSQDERASRSPREQPVEQRRAGVANVELPGRARREPNSHRLLTNAIAWAAIASPRPTASTPSLVLALTLTRSTSVPRAFASDARIASMWPRSFGFSSMMVTSTFPISNPAAPAIATI